ncbi:MAG: nucleoside-triphosphatase [Methanomicrobiales archaeon]|nr:nucleoside-triphosphatase [Methanomicrobiales archaeon]
MRNKNILITAWPGTGKTTLVLKLAAALASSNPVGFTTLEVRKDGIRQGFELNGFDGSSRILADIHLKSTFHVGKYGVNVQGFEEYLETIRIGSGTQIAIIDEIGKMEWFSPRFRSLVNHLLASDVPLIATIAMKGNGDFARIRTREDVRLHTLTRENRDRLGEEILREIRAILGSKE